MTCRGPITSAICSGGSGMRARRILAVGTETDRDRIPCMTAAVVRDASAGDRNAVRTAVVFTAKVSPGASMSTTSLSTRLRKVAGRSSSPTCGSAVTVISAPWPACVCWPGVIETGIRTRFRA